MKCHYCLRGATHRAIAAPGRGAAGMTEVLACFKHAGVFARAGYFMVRLTEAEMTVKVAR